MARTAVAVEQLLRDASVVQSAGTAIDVANGMSIDVGSQPGKYIIFVKNTFAGAKTVTFKAGVNPPAFRSGLGNLTESIAQNATGMFQLEGARFVQADGKVYLDFEAGTTGTVWAFKVASDL